MSEIETLGDAWDEFDRHHLPRPHISYEGIFATAKRLEFLRVQNEQTEARVAALEAEVERLRTGMAALTAEQIGIAAASTERAEAAEAERDRLRNIKKICERKDYTICDQADQIDRLAAAVETLGRCVERCKDRSDASMVIFRDDLTLYRELDKMTAVLAGQKLSAREDPVPPAPKLEKDPPSMRFGHSTGTPYFDDTDGEGHEEG